MESPRHRERVGVAGKGLKDLGTGYMQAGYRCVNGMCPAFLGEAIRSPNFPIVCPCLFNHIADTLSLKNIYIDYVRESPI